jgi:hypothetical protein
MPCLALLLLLLHYAAAAAAAAATADDDDCCWTMMMMFATKRRVCDLVFVEKNVLGPTDRPTDSRFLVLLLVNTALH